MKIIHLLTSSQVFNSFTGAKKSREVVFSVLRDACIDGDLSICEAVKAAKNIFARNALGFYKISLANSTVDSPRNNILPRNGMMA